MLSANEAVAKFMFKNSFPSLYRIHEPPGDDKLFNLETLLRTLGYNIKISGKIVPKDLQSLTNRVKGEPREKVINMFILRSLKLACYSSENAGHFGLALKYYTHFTSPIRRYPDLIVHRLLKELLDLHKQESSIKSQVSNIKHQVSQKRISELHNKLPHIAEISSERERNAMEAERESVKIKQVKYLSERLGDEYDGIITNVTSYGFFVELNDILAEGLVNVNSLMDDYYNYDGETQTLTGEKYKRRFKIGDIVKVIVANVNISAMEIDLTLVEEKKSKNNRKNKKRSIKRR
jgi:ribonuclease R